MKWAEKWVPQHRPSHARWTWTNPISTYSECVLAVASSSMMATWSGANRALILWSLFGECVQDHAIIASSLVWGKESTRGARLCLVRFVGMRQSKIWEDTGLSKGLPRRWVGVVTGVEIGTGEEAKMKERGVRVGGGWAVLEAEYYSWWQSPTLER